MSFEPNVGQFPSSARFVSHGQGYLLELRPEGARFRFAENKSAFELKFVHGNREAAIAGEDKLPGTHSYIPTSDPATWHTGIATYREVEYRQLYPGTDLVFYGNPDHLEYDIRLQAHADPSKVRFDLAGVDSYAVEESGNLALRMRGRELRLLKPHAFQKDATGKLVDVAAAYNISSSGIVTFGLGPYDHSRALNIDPVLDYSFFLPAAVNGYLYIGASTTDSPGNTYIAGTFPVVARTYGLSQNGFFIAKYNASGQEIYNTTFGNTHSPDFGGSVNGIAVDSKGRAYLAGLVSGAYNGGLPYTPNAYQTSAGSPYNNAFLAVLNASGTALIYASYFGGNTEASSVSFDSSGNAYIAGQADSGTFSSLPITPNAPLSTAPAPDSGFLAKFNPNATSGPKSLVYSTYIGAPQSGSSVVNAVAVDSNGDAYVTGNANGGPPYPTSPNAYQYNGRDPSNDVFVSKINAAGTAFAYSALLGPGAGQAIAVDGSGDAYVAGTVYEDDFPTTSGAYQTTYPSGFASELNSEGSALVYSTFLGGPDDLFAGGSSYVVPTNIAIPSGCSSACALYVAGFTTGSDFPMVNAVEHYVPGSQYSAFYVELAGNGASALQSSYFASGPAQFDPYQKVPGIGVDSSGDIYLTGDVETSNLAISKTNASFGEGFLAKIAPPSGAALFAIPQSIKFPTQVVGVSTSQQGLAQPTVLLQNLGTETATISSIEVTPSDRFAQTNNCNGSVPPGGSCTLTLNFTPGAASSNPQTGSIEISSTGNFSPTIQLSGAAENDRFVVATCGGVTPCGGLTFADTTVGSSATAEIITLTNLGNTAAPLTTISSSLPDYGLLTNCPQTGAGLPALASCEISVQFHPTQTGLRPGTITVVATGTSADSISIPAVGTGLLTPNSSSIVLLESVLNFGTETVGLTGGPQSVEVFNNGTSPVTIFAPSVTTTDFSIISNSCTGVLIAPQTSCSMAITFSPTATGTRSGALDIPSSANSTPLTASLVGIGIASAQNLEFSPTSIVFPNEVVGSSSVASTVTVYNAGSDPVTIDRVLVTGAFQITATSCPEATLHPEPSPASFQTCSVTVAFSPKTTGRLTGAITVIDTEGRQSAFSLAGTGVTQTGANDSVEVSPAALVFTDQAVNLSPSTGSGDGTQTVSLTNSSNASITIGTVTGTNTITRSSSSGQFSIWPPSSGDGCSGQTVSAGSSCAVQLAFVPTVVAKDVKGSLTFPVTYADGKAATLSATYSGNALASRSSIAITPDSADFGTQIVDEAAGGILFTITNTGDQPLTLGAATLSSKQSGTNFTFNGYNYSQCNGGGTLEAGQSCVVFVEFQPQTTGTITGTLTINDPAASGGPHKIPLTGVGLPTNEAITVSQLSVNFGNHPVGGSGAPVAVYVSNESASTVGGFTYTLGGTNASDFTLNSSNCPTSLWGKNISGPQGSPTCSLLIAFSPSKTSLGVRSATVTVAFGSGNVPGSPITIKLTGTGVPDAPAVVLFPSTVSFANTEVGSKSQNQAFSINNSGSANLTISKLVVTNSAEFTIVSDGCLGKTLASGSDCLVYVAFSPASAGNRSGSIAITDNAANSPQIEQFAGVGFDSPKAVLTPSSENFGDQDVETTSAGKSIVLSNTGTAPLEIASVKIAGTDAGDFKQTNNCPAALSAGDNCTITVSFSPQTAGSLSASLVVTDNANNVADSTQSATLTGTGIKSSTAVLPPKQLRGDGHDAPGCASCSDTRVVRDVKTARLADAALNPASLTFANQDLGTISAGRRLVLSSTGNAPLAIASIAIGGSDPSDFRQTNNCPSALSPATSCTITITFLPQAEGSRSASLVVTDDAKNVRGSTQSATLRGTGVI